jgi:glycosyltransferase involved in cell wall biosynthesis
VPPASRRRKPFSVLHVLGTAAPAGAAHVHIVKHLWAGLDREVFRIEVCFVEKDGPLADELREAGMRVAVVPWHGARDPLGGGRFAWTLRRSRPAICHQHVVGRSLPALVHLVTSAKIVTHLGGAVNEMGEPIDWSRAARLADAVISTSHATAAAAGISARVIYPGAFVTASTEARPIGAEPVVCAASRFVPIKGLETLVAAMDIVLRKFPRAHLRIAGDGPAGNGLRELAAELQIGERVTFLGWQEDLNPLFQSSDVFAVPSVAEGLGIAALEAMAAGLPVVASNVGGLPEVVDHGRTGWLVPPGDPDALAARIAELLSDRDLRLRMGHEGRDRVTEKFAPATMVRQIQSVYAGLVTNGRPGQPSLI